VQKIFRAEDSCIPLKLTNARAENRARIINQAGMAGAKAFR
jgi:hypothetical protein